MARPRGGGLRRDCPQQDQHTPCPEGYVEWHAWAEEKRKRFTQHRCSGCGRWVIWRPKA